jgi:hypothetical protein
MNQKLLPLLLFFISTFALASDFQSPRTAALGGAGHAAPLLNDAIYLNPSFGAFLPSYSIGVNYDFYHGDPQANGTDYIHGHDLNLSIQDGRSQMFQAGVGLTLRNYDKILNIGASKAAIKQLGFGLGAKITFPNDPSFNSAHDMTASVSFVATEWFNVSGIVDNILDSSDAREQGLYREYILGTKFNIKKIMMIYVDPHLSNAPQGSYGYEAGVELTVLEDLYIRGGDFHDSNIPELENTRGNGYSVGLGWISPRFSLDYALKHVLAPVINIQNSIGFTLYI